MEEKADGCWSRDRCFFELLRGDPADDLLNLRAGFCVVINGKLTGRASIVGSFGFRVEYEQENEQTGENSRRKKRW